MKNVLFTIVAMLTLSTAFGQSNDENRAVAVAKQAIVQSCGENAGHLQYSVTENYVCNVINGFGVSRTITFYRTPNCPPNQPCIQVIETVGQVVVGCDYSIESVSCGGAVAQ